MTAALAVALLLSALFAAHLVAYAIRTTGPTAPLDRSPSPFLPSRRLLFTRFAYALVGGLVTAAAAPRLAGASPSRASTSGAFNLAQAVGCPPGTNDCGDGYCCAGDTPHYCRASHVCYRLASDAAADCGSTWTVCGRAS